MTVYYVLFAVALVLMVLKYTRFRISIVSITNQKKLINEKWLYLFLVFGFAAVIIGFRDENVGIDTKGYIQDFYNINTNGIKGREIKSEIINALLKWLCGRVSSNPQFYLFIHAIIVCFLFARFIFSESEDPYLSTVIFIGMFFVPTMNLMRQWLAMSLGITAYTFYRKNQNIKAAAILLMAILCHTTASVLLIIPIIEKIKNKKRIILPTVFFSFFLILFRYQFFSFITRFVTRYNGYLTRTMFMNEGAFNIKNLIFATIILGIAYVLLFRRSIIDDVEVIDTLFTYEILMIIALAFSLCGTTYYMFHRVVYYFSVYLIIIIPSIIKKLYLNKLVSLFVIIAMMIMLVRSGSYDNNGISNYVWCW